MKVIGLTGGIGMGKSASADHLKNRGLLVIDTDVLARDVVAPGQPAWGEIRTTFGAEVFGPTGEVRRDMLARIVFADQARLRELEAIVHPRIRERWETKVEDARRAGEAACVVVIPLLYETRAEHLFDFVICTACSAPTQRQRLLQRGWAQEQIEQRIRCQWPADRKMDRAQYLVWTEPRLDIHMAQLDHILAREQLP